MQRGTFLQRVRLLPKQCGLRLRPGLRVRSRFDADDRVRSHLPAGWTGQQFLLRAPLSGDLGLLSVFRGLYGDPRELSLSGQFLYASLRRPNALLGKTCPADTLNGGTCLTAEYPLPAGFPQSAIYPNVTGDISNTALCYQGGTATGACDPNADRSHPELLCVAGSRCSTAGPTPMCTPACTYQDMDFADGFPTLPATGCSVGQVCIDQVCLPALGVDAGS